MGEEYKRIMVCMSTNESPYDIVGVSHEAKTESSAGEKGGFTRRLEVCFSKNGTKLEGLG
jgi:hypothetical protein